MHRYGYAEEEDCVQNVLDEKGMVKEDRQHGYIDAVVLPLQRSNPDVVVLGEVNLFGLMGTGRVEYVFMRFVFFFPIVLRLCDSSGKIQDPILLL